MKARIFPLISIASLLSLFLFFFLYSQGYFGDSPMGQSSNATSPLIVPAPYAFSIWSVIYLGIVIFPIYQLVNYPKRHPLWNQVHLWFSLNLVGNWAWLLCASQDWLWTSVIVMLVLLYTLIKINALLSQIRAGGGKVNFWLEQLLFSLYFAWITLATALNFSSALHFYEWGGLGLSNTLWTILISLVAAAIAGAVSWHYRDKAYAAVVVWAFTALAMKHTDNSLFYLAIGIVALFAGLIIRLFWKRKSLG